MNPPRLAAWLLGWLNRNCDPLVGDLYEEWERGRPAGWFWRQAMWALYERATTTAMENRPLAILGLALAGLGVLAIVFAGRGGQTQFEIRAAAPDAVDGWVLMERPGGDGHIWVAPAASLTSADIARAQQSRGDAGRLAVEIDLTDAGAAKMQQLSRAQFGKPVAMILDGRLILAPTIRSQVSNEALLTGTGPDGLTPDEVTRVTGTIADHRGRSTSRSARMVTTVRWKWQPEKGPLWSLRKAPPIVELSWSSRRDRTEPRDRRPVSAGTINP